MLNSSIFFDIVLKNMLVNQEALTKQMLEITIKSNNEEVLFSDQRKGHSKY